MADDANNPPPNNAGRFRDKDRRTLGELSENELADVIRTPGRHEFTIDATPTWVSLIPVFVAVIENGSAEGRKIAIEELTRLAKFADEVNAREKGK